MNKIFGKKWFRMILFISLGAVAGYSYYYFIGCSTNSCAITSNPYISSGYGMMVGLLMSFDSKKKKTKTDEGKGD